MKVAQLKNLLLLFVMLSHCILKAQDANKKDTVGIDDYYIDFAVPDLTAFNMLGLKEKDAIVRPGSVKEFGVALANIVGTDGKLSPTASVEWSPLMSLLKNNEDLWKSNFKWQNVLLSMGTNQVDTLGTRFAYGVRWVPFDYSDPVSDPAFQAKIAGLLRSFDNQAAGANSDYLNRLSAIVTQRVSDGATAVRIMGVLDIANQSYIDTLRSRFYNNTAGSIKAFLTDSLNSIAAFVSLPEADKNAIDPFIAQFVSKVVGRESLNDYITDRIRKLKADFKQKNWNAFSLQVSAGWVSNSTTSNFGDLAQEKFTAFTGVAFRVGGKGWIHDHAQAIVHVQYTNDYTQVTKEKDRFSSGARILLGNANNRLSIEGMYIKSTFDDPKTEYNQYFKWSVGGEIRMAQGSWLEIALGGIQTSNGVAPSEILPRFGLKHALQNKRRYELN